VRRSALIVWCGWLMVAALFVTGCQARRGAPETQPAPLLPADGVPGYDITTPAAPSSTLPFAEPTVLLTAMPTATSAPPAVPALIAGPYLGDVTIHTAVVSWVTRGAGSLFVRYGEAGSEHVQAESEHTSTPAGDWHVATLTGLVPGTAYRYGLYGEDSQPVGPAASLSTAPPPGTDEFTFVVLGDSRPGNRDTAEPTTGARRVAGQLALQAPAFVLHTGDLVAEGWRCDGVLSVWEQYLRTYFGLYNEILARTPFYVVPGNHDFASDSCGREVYIGVHALPRNAPTGDEEEYYSFDWGNAHIVALDSEQSSAPGSPQYNWLEQDLRQTTQRWKFVVLHYPPYSSGESGSSVTVRENWVPLFEQYGVDLVFSGHNHTFERTCPILHGACTTAEDGVVYFVSAGGGAVLHDVTGAWFSLAYDSVHHLLTVDVRGCRLVVTAIDSMGQVIDRFGLEHCAE